MNKLATAIAGLALGIGTSALAAGPSPFSGVPGDYHLGEGSCVFSTKGDMPGQFFFQGVPSDGQHAAMCDTIVAAFNSGRSIGWGAFPSPMTVPCDPNFCNGANTAERISNFVGVPNP